MSTRSSTVSLSSILEFSTAVSSSRNHPDYVSSSIRVKIVPPVDCAVSVELRAGGGGVTDSSSAMVSALLLFVSPLATVTTVALKLLAELLLALVLSFGFVLAFIALDVFAFHALVTVQGVPPAVRR